jgi:hypothetical protein
MLSENNSFFKLPKNVRRVSLTKRTSMSQLRDNTSSHNSRGQLSDRHMPEKNENSKIRPMLVEPRSKRMLYSRYQWLTILRNEFFRITDQKAARHISKKTLVGVLQHRKYVT